MKIVFFKSFIANNPKFNLGEKTEKEGYTIPSLYKRSEWSITALASFLELNNSKSSFMFNVSSFTVLNLHKAVTKIILSIIDHITLNRSKSLQIWQKTIKKQNFIVTTLWGFMTVKEDALSMKLLLNYESMVTIILRVMIYVL